MPTRYGWIDVPEYEGFRAKVWLNFSDDWLRGEMEAAQAEGTKSRAWAAMKQVLVEHNGWCDVQGNPLPPPTEDAFWDAIPNELMTFLMAAISGAPGKAVASLRKNGQL